MGLEYKPLYPWVGGLNTSVDPIILDPQNLVQADNIVFTNSGSRRKRGGQSRYNTASLATAATNVVYFTNYWATVSSAKRERFVSVALNNKVYRSTPATNGTWSSFNTITLSVQHGGVTSTVMNNDLIMGFKGSNGVPLVWVDQSSSANLTRMVASSGSLPFSNPWIVQTFIERLFVAGDPANPDTLFVSSTGDYTNWTVSSTEGKAITLVIGAGDNDPEGITAVFPGTGGNRVLYVAKRRHLYAVDVSSPDQTDWSITMISNQIGVINPNSVAALDETDVVFLSDRGMHALSQVLQTTAVIPGEFLSFPIQYDYNSVVNSANRGQISLSYVPSLNSVLFSCKRVGMSTYETIYGFNIVLKQWFRWTSTPCNFIFDRFNKTSGTDEIYACDAGGFVNKLQQTAFNDFGSAIVTTLKSGFIYPKDIPLFEYNTTRIILIFRSRDNATFGLQYSLDGVTSNSAVIQERFVGGNILGTTQLGNSFILGSVQGVKPYFVHTGGVGSSIQITITHNALNKDFELFGIILEYEDAGDRQNPYNASVYN